MRYYNVSETNPCRFYLLPSGFRLNVRQLSPALSTEAAVKTDILLPVFPKTKSPALPSASTALDAKSALSANPGSTGASLFFDPRSFAAAMSLNTTSVRILGKNG